jgi:hypothetical protein
VNYFARLDLRSQIAACAAAPACTACRDAIATAQVAPKANTYSCGSKKDILALFTAGLPATCSAKQPQVAALLDCTADSVQRTVCRSTVCNAQFSNCYVNAECAACLQFPTAANVANTKLTQCSAVPRVLQDAGMPATCNVQKAPLSDLVVCLAQEALACTSSRDVTGGASISSSYSILLSTSSVLAAVAALVL